MGNLMTKTALGIGAVLVIGAGAVLCHLVIEGIKSLWR